MKFTLIEIMLVISIVAFLAILLIPKMAVRKDTHPPRNKDFRRTWRKLHLIPLALERFLPRHKFSARVQFVNIAEGTYEHGVKSYLPDAGTTARYLIYKQGSDADHCAITGLNDIPLGSSDDLADANNLTVPISINLFGAKPGTVRVVTDGTVNNGDPVKCGATGQVTQAAAGDMSFGRALITSDMSKAAGDVISIIHDVPFKNQF